MSAMSSSAVRDWPELLYDRLFADMLLHRDDVAAELAFLKRALAIGQGASVLDQGCGVGSLAVPLAAAGLRVFGVDQCPDYVAQARQAAAARGVPARFEAADAASYRPPEVVAGVFSWWTSWGHAADDAGNLAILSAAHDALAPGGRFVLDYMNVAGVLRGFLPEVTTRRYVAELEGEVELRRFSRVDLTEGLLVKDWVYRLPNGSEVRRGSAMRLYLAWQVTAMLRTAGFIEVDLLGSMKGEELAMDSSRLIAVARRA